MSILPNIAPTIDLNAVTTTEIPGTGTVTDLTFPNIGSGTGAGTGIHPGVGGNIIYQNVGMTTDGRQIDVRVTVEAASGNPELYSVGDGTSSINVHNSLLGPASATLLYEFIDHATGEPIVGDYTVKIGDLDQNIAGFPARREVITIDTTKLDAFQHTGDFEVLDAVNGTVLTNAQAIADPSITFDPTDNATLVDGDNAVFLSYKGVSEIRVGYEKLGDAATAFGGFFSFDATFDSLPALVAAVDFNADHADTFFEGDSPICVAADTLSITDDGSIASATITLANPQADDQLNIPASLPSGITVDPASTATNIILVGNATPDDYETAIKAITFENTSDAPNTSVVRTINVQVLDNDGATSNLATASINVIPVNDAPVATADLASQIVGSPVTISVLGNDTDIDNALDPASLQITGSAGPGQPLTVAGEGTWSVDTATGAITFTPVPGFTGNPAAISYTVADVAGERSTSVSVSVLPLYSAPHLDLSGPSNYSGAVLYGHSTAPYASGAGGAGVFGSIGNEVAGSGVGLAYDGSSVDVSQLSSATLADAVENQDYISMTVTTLASIPEAWLQNTVKRNAGGTYEFAIAISTDGFQTATVLSQANPGSDFTAPFYDAPGSSYPFAPATDYQLAANTTYEIRAYIYNATSGTARWDDFYVFYSNDPVNHETTFTEGGCGRFTLSRKYRN